ncbi:MAG: alanine--tRNA ligase [Pirellulaceae bacterium]|nr:alanine--tRNA ligase [Pirellulaceae bacterium]
MKTDEIREKYLAFFESKGHARKESDVLVPKWDPSVLFTPAGMNQFKDHFLGKVELEFTKATTSQKCLRTGDIENVGRTAYHHTFFEMLGNFSFGDYFKREAISWAWEFLTSKKWLGLASDRLSVTVYKDDDEAEEIWKKEIGLRPEQVTREDEDENFWPANAPSEGPDGVCGPCSEIYYHPEVGEKVEIWNLVFTQFNRVGEPPNNLKPLPSKNIDTGMGLERIAAVMQGVETNYHIDTLFPIVHAAAEIFGFDYVADSEEGRRLRRITDHVRACTFSIHEDVFPDNNKENYVIKRLLRRAVLDGHQMGIREPFLYQLVPKVVEMVKGPYPELEQSIEKVQEVIRREEENFLATIDAGLVEIQHEFATMKKANQSQINGRRAASIYQSNGFPPELVEIMGQEYGFTFDWPAYHQAMEEHGQRSGAGRKELFASGPIESIKSELRGTSFVGYDSIEKQVEIKYLVLDNEIIERVNEPNESRMVEVILDETPFYAEAGGQVGDSGEIRTDSGRLVVLDTQKNSDLVIHTCYLAEGTVVQGDSAKALVAPSRRDGLQRAHSATHILHYALHETLGSHANQKGSKVEEDWLRFDFTHMQSLDDTTLQKIEAIVSQKIMEASPIECQLMPLSEAKKTGAMMLFGEKYPDPVRVVSMGNFSKEFCGGTHLTNTSQVGQLIIVSEEAVAAGTRRIVALTGEKAKSYLKEVEDQIAQLESDLGKGGAVLPQKVIHLVEEVKSLKKALQAGQTAAAHNIRAEQQVVSGNKTHYPKDILREIAQFLNIPLNEISQRVGALLVEKKRLLAELESQANSEQLTAEGLLEKATQTDGVTIVVSSTSGGNPNTFRQLIDQLRQQASPVAVLLATSSGEGKVTLVAGLSRDLVEKGYKAGDWIRPVAAVVGGSGGGRADLAQAGGKDPGKLPEALDLAREKMVEILSA